MEYKICLNNLHFYSFIGVAEEERKIGNEFKVSLTVFIPYSEEIEKDEIEATVSYADLFEIIKEEMGVKRKLLEKTASEISRHIRQKFPQIKNGEITIEKVHPPIPGMLGSASVSLLF